MGVGQVCVEYGAVSDLADVNPVTSADMRRPRTRLHGNHSTSKYHEFVFVSLFRATAYCLFIEQRMGVGHICVEYGAVSDCADVD